MKKFILSLKKRTLRKVTDLLRDKLIDDSKSIHFRITVPLGSRFIVTQAASKETCAKSYICHQI